MSRRHRERFEDKSGASETSVRVHTKWQGQTDHRSRSTYNIAVESKSKAQVQSLSRKVQRLQSFQLLDGERRWRRCQCSHDCK